MDEVMPEGLYEGEPLSEVPTEYLKSAVHALKDSSPELSNAIAKELTSRGVHFDLASIDKARAEGYRVLVARALAEQPCDVAALLGRMRALLVKGEWRQALEVGPDLDDLWQLMARVDAELARRGPAPGSLVPSPAVQPPRWKDWRELKEGS